jgi:hypothetical protein
MKDSISSNVQVYQAELYAECQVLEDLPNKKINMLYAPCKHYSGLSFGITTTIGREIQSFVV